MESTGDLQLDTHVDQHLSPLGLTLADVLADAAHEPHPSRRYSTAAAVDAFYRVRAAVTGAAAETTFYAPALPPVFPVALVAGDEPGTFHLATSGQETQVHGRDLLDAFAALGVTTERQTHVTLVVDRPAILTDVAALARQPRTPVSLAATLDWWTQRADHPGSGATRVLSRDLALRWTLARTPDSRPSLQDWNLALGQDGLPATTSAGLLAIHLAECLAAGSTLPGLLTAYSEDSRSWAWNRKNAGHRWRPYDTRRDAALGLLTRSHAAEQYSSLRLGDPIVADAQTRTGTVVETTIVDVDEKAHTVQMTASRPLIRHRVGSRLEAWLGDARTLHAQVPALTGTLTDVKVTAGGTLDITLGEVVKPGRFTAGDDLTLRPRQTDPFQQGTFRSMYHQHFGGGRNWLARTAAPSATRRPVPLDVIVAAADD